MYFLSTVILSTAIVCSVLFRLPEAVAQAAPKSQSKQAEVSDGELRAFAKAYVEYHQIRQQYEQSLKTAADADKKKIQDEANEKIKKALAKQDLTAEHYTQIFERINQDSSLREKTLKLIEEQRKRP